jgi:hypothetical protein
MTTIEAPTKTIADRCHAALQAALASVERVAPTRWLVRDRRASESSVLVRLVDGFLLLTDDFSLATPPSRWDLLKANANLTGLAKFSAAPGGGLCLRAEIPVQAEGNLPLRISQACGAFAAAQHLTQLGQGNTGVTPAEAAPTDILKLVEAAGWRCSSQKGDVCAVPLETLQGGHTAIVTAPAGAVRVCTELASWDTLSAPCREGLAGMLLTANARLRLARAVVAEDESGGAAQLEVLLQAPVAPAELRSALEALSVGADTCVPTADLLQEETAAKLFLAVWGGPHGREDTEPSTERMR